MLTNNVVMGALLQIGTVCLENQEDHGQWSPKVIVSYQEMSARAITTTSAAYRHDKQTKMTIPEFPPIIPVEQSTNL